MTTHYMKIFCPLCQAPSGIYYVPIKQFKIYKCSNCGLEHTYPIPSVADLKFFYSTYTDIRAASDVVTINARRNLKLLTTFGYDERKTLLDYGTGDGGFVEVAGESCFGVDFKKSASKPRIYTNLTDLPIKSYDFITLFGVLEHLANPIETLLDLRLYKKPNGIIVITTVDAEGTIPYYYKPPEHLTYWTKSAFESLCKIAGIEIIEYKPYRMLQRSEIYIDRLLSRVPIEYKHVFDGVISRMSEYIEVPTNEVFVVGKWTT